MGEIRDDEQSSVHTRVLNDAQVAELERALDELAEVTDRVRDLLAGRVARRSGGTT